MNDEKIRNKMPLNNYQWRTIVNDGCFYDSNNVLITVEIVENNYLYSTRHTETHKIIFLLNDKFYSLEYENSVKDEMGWSECNYGDTNAIEVFPKIISTTIYE